MTARMLADICVNSRLRAGFMRKRGNHASLLRFPMFGAFLSLVTILLFPAALAVFWVSIATKFAPVLLVCGAALLVPYSVMRAVSRAGRMFRRR